MARTLLRVPRMFTKEDLLGMDPRLPEDYDEKAKEFWTYVDSRLSALGVRIKKIYLESIGVSGKRHLDMLGIADPAQHRIVKKLLDSGAELIEAESPELVLETMSWMQRIQDSLYAGRGEDTSGVQAMAGWMQESLRERDEFVGKRVGESLREGETGALFMDLSRRIELPDDIRVIVTCPFQPRDYVNSWLVGLRARDQAEAAKSKREKQDRGKGEQKVE